MQMERRAFGLLPKNFIDKEQCAGFGDGLLTLMSLAAGPAWDKDLSPVRGLGYWTETRLPFVLFSSRRADAVSSAQSFHIRFPRLGTGSSHFVHKQYEQEEGPSHG